MPNGLNENIYSAIARVNMGRKRRQHNPFAAKKREKKAQAEKGGDPRPQREPYEDITRENEAFVKYYNMQKICASEEEWQQFLATIRENLPTTFRVTGFKDEAKALLEIIKTKFFSEYVNGVAELNNKTLAQVEEPLPLPWYPDGLAYQLELTRKDIRRSESLFRLHNFLIVETNCGSISRQEAVSMIPPLVLNVQPTDKVLDMCAAPGSKTAQLIEALHAQPEQHRIPPGFVVANDVDNNRCYMLVHQAKRLNSPCFVVTNHDSSHFPELVQTTSDGKNSIVKFTKILCDVPCSGDGTLRKNPDIWTKWNLSQGYALHGIQYRITMRGAEMLEVGGRLVYSTCSLNPIENEAVLQRLIKDSNGALEIVDAAHLVPGLKFNPGMTDWILASKEADEFYTSFDQVPQKYHTVIRPTMFPLPKDEIEKIGLEKCMRVLPHLQNTGGFFVAVLEKKGLLPNEKVDVEEVLKKREHIKPKADENGKSAPWGPQRKRKRLQGYKEDPYIFFKQNDDDWLAIKKFYDLDDSFNQNCLLTRCVAARKKNVYYCSNPIRDLVVLNEDFIKIINTGVKAFSRCENRHTEHQFRLAQEGLQTTNAFMGDTRRINIQREDLILLLNCTDPTQPPPTTDLQESTQTRWKELEVGSCILKYADSRLTLHVVGWRGRSSLRAYVDKNETIHILRLLNADLSKFEVNKYDKTKELAVEVKAEDSDLINNEKNGSSNELNADDKTEKMDVAVKKEDLDSIKVENNGSSIELSPTKKSQNELASVDADVKMAEKSEADSQS